MAFALALKVFSDCCIVFAILGAFPMVFSCSHPLLFMAAIAAIAAGLSTFLAEKGKAGLGRACAVLPFSGLLLAAAPMELSILLPPAVYTAAVILRGSMQLEYYSYRQFFLRSLCLLGAFIVVLGAFTVMEAMTGPEKLVMHPEIALRYSLVHLLCGVILQRQLRLGAFGKGHGDAGQIAAMLGGTGLVLFGFVLAEPALRKGGAAIFQLASSFILGAAMAVLELFSSLLDQVELETMAQQIAERKEDTLPSYNMGIIADQIDRSVQNTSDEPSLWWIVPVAILLLGAMVLMILSFRRSGAEAKSVERVSIAPPMKQTRRDPRRSYRWRIRQLYRDFLKTEQKQGLTLRKHHTSLDVLQRISPDTNAAGADALRKIYISARYDMGREPGRDDYEAARAALKKCRE